YSNITGGADGLQGVTIAPVLGLFRFDLFGHTAYVYSLILLFLLFLLARRIVNSPFGLSLLAVKGNALRASAIGIPVDWRLVAIAWRHGSGRSSAWSRRLAGGCGARAAAESARPCLLRPKCLLLPKRLTRLRLLTSRNPSAASKPPTMCRCGSGKAPATP